MSQLPSFEPTEHPHRRFNPLTQEWVLCSPHRANRPWQGKETGPDLTKKPIFDKTCFLCPGNTRSGEGQVNPDYPETFIFENDFAAVRQEEVDMSTTVQDDLFQMQEARGKCYVVCFNPRHDLSVAEMTVEELIPVIKAWQRLYNDVSQQHPWIKYIQIFENKVEGCSSPHPHCQSWTLSYIPTRPALTLASMKSYAQSHPTNPTLLLNYAQKELSDGSRVVFSNDHFVAVVPYWATWPFESMILPTQRRIPHISELTAEETPAFADALRRLTCRYDNLFKCEFPYSMGMHQCPTLNDTENMEIAQLHVAFNPPLLRSATVRKYLVGFEMFAEAQRDLTPEQAAARLRDCSEQHYKQSMGAGRS